MLPLLATANRSTLRVIVTERGNLESRQTVDGVCEVRGYDNKIIFIVPEGTHVQEGDVVVRLDPSKIEEDIAKQEIEVNQAHGRVEASEQQLAVQLNKNESDLAAAELELTLAKLDLDKYLEGEYKVSMSETKGQIALARAEYEQVKDKLEHTRQLVKRGFRSREQLQAIEQEVERSRFFLERDERKLEMLETFDHRRKLTELEAKSVEAERKLVRAINSAKAEEAKARSEFERAKAGAELAEKQLSNLREQLAKCTITAKQAGVLAYSNEETWRSDGQIREGATVYQRQKIFSLPDMSVMQVKVNVHESVVKKVQPEQQAEIRVDAFPSVVMRGTVKSVAPLADSNQSWLRGGVKEYTTVVHVDDTQGVDLRPGMTAEVRIQVNELSGALTVPVQAVTQHQHEHYVYVLNGRGFERRRVKVGENNEKLVQILEGLELGAQVALDARLRGVADFDQEESTPSEPEPSLPATPVEPAEIASTRK